MSISTTKMLMPKQLSLCINERFSIVHCQVWTLCFNRSMYLDLELLCMSVTLLGIGFTGTCILNLSECVSVTGRWYIV